VGKTSAIYVMFLCDVARQKLLKSADVSRSYSKNNVGTVFLRHGILFLLLDSWHSQKQHCWTPYWTYIFNIQMDFGL